MIANLEFVLAVRDQFPVLLLRAAYQGLARAYLVLGRQQEAAEALRRSGLGPAASDWPGERRMHSPAPLPTLPTRATWLSRWTSSPRACSAIPTAASWPSSGKRSWSG